MNKPQTLVISGPGGEVEIPLAAIEEPTSRLLHLDVQLRTMPQTKTFRRLMTALERLEPRLADGRRISGINARADSLRWLLEALATAAGEGNGAP